MLRAVHETDATARLDLSEPTWVDTVSFGPPDFEAYGRLLLMPDPERPGQRWNDVDLPDDWPHDEDQIRVALDALARWTRTPDDAFFCLWDGEETYGDLPQPTGTEQFRRPAFADEVLHNPSLIGPHRKYHVFRGALTGLGQWGAADYRPGSPRGYLAPAFIWPADRAWCLANDTDSHWVGIGASEEAMAALCALESIEVVPADREVHPPEYT